MKYIIIYIKVTQINIFVAGILRMPKLFVFSNYNYQL